MLKYIFMGTPPFAASILEKLCDELYPPALVITQEAKAQGRGQKVIDTAVAITAKNKNLKCLATSNVNLGEPLTLMESVSADLILVVAFGQILKDSVLNMPKICCLNVHGSLLPKYRGAAPIQRAIWDGETKTGITIQKMAKKLDTGDILLQKHLSISSEDTSHTLFEKLSVLGGEALLESVQKIESGKYTFTPQDEKLATYAKKLEKEEAVLDFSMPASVLERRIRALLPWPIAETKLFETRVKILKASIGEESSKQSGTILTDSKSYLKIVCGEGSTLSVLEVQPDNRKRMGIQDFLRGYVKS